MLWDAVSGAHVGGVLRVLALAGVLVLVLRLRPWRWVLPYLRSGGRRG